MYFTNKKLSEIKLLIKPYQFEIKIASSLVLRDKTTHYQRKVQGLIENELGATPVIGSIFLLK